MNQNNVRQISPEEIARAQGLTPEELQKTQVLNLKDIEETVRFEKMTSKKPAAIVAIIGITAILFGATFQISTSLQKSKEKKLEKRAVEKVAHKVEEKTLTCVKTTLNNQDGTDTVYTYSFDFEDNKLVGYNKTFNIIETAGKTEGANTIANYKKEYSQTSNLPKGYDLSIKEEQKGITIITNVDFKLLDLTKLPQDKKVEYQKNTEYDVIKKEMLEKGYTVE